MEEGTILRWLKATGDEVERGEELAEIETDKATMTYESDSSGVLEIVAAEGETLPIGTLIARIGGGSPSLVAAEQPAQGAAPAPAAAPAATEGPPDEAPAAAPAPAATPAPPQPEAGTGERVKASPIARRMAKAQGIDLHALTGTGPGGRIVKADVEGSGGAAPAPGPAAPAPPPAAVTSPGETGTAKGDVTVQELSRTQQVVARRMAEAKATIPEFTLTTKIDMERCVELRAQFKALELEVVPSYNDMIVKACGVALREFPRANGSYKDGRFELYSRVNVGVAVAAQDALVVPTVFDGDRKTLGVIAAETRALAERVRSGVITPPELSGGTFTVSNLGMYGVTEFVAVINPPQAAILAVGAMAPEPVARDGEVVVRHTMAVTLACDHRILYGADAAQFLSRIRALLEQPAGLML
jgi:pyruvate dehydrogenase E2 component (dihydrolipoamide acetyltransferase)